MSQQFCGLVSLGILKYLAVISKFAVDRFQSRIFVIATSIMPFSVLDFFLPGHSIQHLVRQEKCAILSKFITKAVEHVFIQHTLTGDYKVGFERRKSNSISPSATCVKRRLSRLVTPLVPDYWPALNFSIGPLWVVKFLNLPHMVEVRE